MEQTIDMLKDDIKTASDTELLRLYRFTLSRNRKGRLDDRVRRIIKEIKKRNTLMFESQIGRCKDGEI